MKRVLFIDPGEKCGWARADVDDQGNWSEVRHGITPLKEMALALYRAQMDTGTCFSYVPSDRPSTAYDVIGYERFVLFKSHALQQAGSDMQTSQMVGMIRLIAWLSGTRLVSQGADVQGPRGSARASAPRWLKDYLSKFPKRHDESHDASALRHLWAWCFKNYDVDPSTHRWIR